MLRVAGQSASFSPCCIGSAAERKIRLCSRTAASTPSMCCWRAGEMRARRPCSVLLSESASSTPCGDCCDRQAVLEAVGRWWASCVLLGQMCGRTARRTSTGACWRRLRCWRTGCLRVGRGVVGESRTAGTGPARFLVGNRAGVWFHGRVSPPSVQD